MTLPLLKTLFYRSYIVPILVLFFIVEPAFSLCQFQSFYFNTEFYGTAVRPEENSGMFQRIISLSLIKNV